MKYHFAKGSYLEADAEPRSTQYHRRIVKAEPIPGTRSGNTLTLECGHKAYGFGDLQHTHGVVLCTACRDAADKA